MHGNVISLFGINPQKTDLTLTYKGGEYKGTLLPNEELVISDNGLYTVNRVPFR